MWALAAVSGSCFVLLLDQTGSRRLDVFGASMTSAGPGEAMSRGDAAALARAVLLRLDDANRTGNYSIFRSMAAPDFQKMNTVEDLQRIFSWLRTAQLPLSSAAWLGPDSLSPVVIENDGLLHVRGALPNVPGGMSFDLLMQQVDSQWLVFGVAVYRG